MQVLSQYYVQYIGSIGGHGITWCEDIDLFKYLCDIWRAQSNAYYRGNSPSKHLFNTFIVFHCGPSNIVTLRCIKKNFEIPKSMYLLFICDDLELDCMS